MEYLEYGGQIDVMYSDFEKAFDKGPHIIVVLCSALLVHFFVRKTV